MRLDIIPGPKIDDPSESEIISALEQVFASDIDAVVLIKDTTTNEYIQTAGGHHIEYCVGVDGPIYAVDGIPLLQAIDLFLSYARGEEKWKTSVPWSVHTEKLGPHYRFSPGKLILVIALGVVAGLLGCCVLMELWGLLFPN